MRRLTPFCLFALACATTSTTPAPATAPATTGAARPEETHLEALQQLTFQGENAEAYWSFDGQKLSMQRRAGDAQCDRIYTMRLFEDGQPLAQPELVPLSSGKGATTCAHYLPDNQHVLYASTHLGGDVCPPKPDMSRGYVWALYDSYEIFKSRQDGSDLTRLTDSPGYDAEGTVCGKDGSIVFTSVRDGDLELYRMDQDGGNVRRLTFEPGYDGGAFFSADCSKIVWRASRPKPGPELDEYKALLAQGLVRPTKLELFVAEADGSDVRQVTYLDAASFAPFFFPDGQRILFSSNYGDPKGREFEIFAIDVDGTNLERITFSPGFDGFPMFSPDGEWLLFSSNRNARPESRDTNVFLARWKDHPPGAVSAGAAERIAADAAWLADPAREGRGVGTKGLEEAGAWLEQQLKTMGLEPLGSAGSYRSSFEVTTAVALGEGNRLVIAGREVPEGDWTPLAWSAEGHVSGPAVLAGYAVHDAELGIDDFANVDVRGKIVVARRFAPDHDKLATPDAQRRAGDLRRKAFVARNLGAKALVIVDWPDPLPPRAARRPAAGAAEPGTPGQAPGVHGQAASAPHASHGHHSHGQPASAPHASHGHHSHGQPASAAAGGSSPHAAHGPAADGGRPGAARPSNADLPPEAPLPMLRPDGSGDSGIPVVVVERSAIEPVWKKLNAGQRVDVQLSVALEQQRTPVFNLVARIPAANNPDGSSVVIGAHYDHLGFGGPDSLAPDKHVPHLGADDNASGTATVLEIARTLNQQRDQLAHDVMIAFFSAEEIGVLGSSALVSSKPAWLRGARAMLNLDMVGRMRDNTLNVLGSESAKEWPDLVRGVCERERVACKVSGDGYGPSDHMPFYTSGLPVLHFFTGAHPDYHKPSDVPALLNDAGMARVAAVVAGVARDIDGLTYQKAPAPTGRGDARSWSASLGTVPDYAGPPAGTKGVLLADVRPGGGAALAGMKRGDILIKLGKFDVGSVEDLMFVLMQARPGETVTAVVVRDGEQLALETTFQESRRR